MNSVQGGMVACQRRMRICTGTCRTKRRLHAGGGANEYNEEQRAHAAPVVSTIGYPGTSRFWFESFQNWQSEFLSVAAIVLLSIFLRQKGSPESKPVDASHSQTGND